MQTPAPDYTFYEVDHRGTATADEFYAALPLACARLRALVGPTVNERHAEACMHAACALVDRVAGVDRRGEVASETVGATSVTYSAAAQERVSDYDAAYPWLAGTGLLFRGVPLR